MAELNLGHVVGPGVPTGGTSGQVLKKNSSTNFDTSWTNNDATTIPMSSSDSTTISATITALNSKLLQPTTYTVATISELNTALSTVCAGLSEKGIIRIVIRIYGGSFEPYNSGQWECELWKLDTGYYAGIAYSYKEGRNIIQLKCNNGTWTHDELALNSNVCSGTPGAINTLDALKTLLSGYASSLSDGAIKPVVLYVGFNSSPFADGQRLAGVLTRYNSTNYVAELHDSNTCKDVTIGYNNGTWTISSLNDKIGKYDCSDSSVDVDTLGTGFVYASSSSANLPEASACFVLTFRNDGQKAAQIALKRSGSGMWIRQCSGGTWGNWAKVTTS